MEIPKEQNDAIDAYFAEANSGSELDQLRRDLFCDDLVPELTVRVEELQKDLACTKRLLQDAIEEKESEKPKAV